METPIENTESFTSSKEDAQNENKPLKKASPAFSLPKLSAKDKRSLVKHGMVASLTATALSAFLPVPYAKKVHTVAGLTFLGLCAVHTLQNTPKKK